MNSLHDLEISLVYCKYITKKPCLIPLPLHFFRLKARGRNDRDYIMARGLLTRVLIRCTSIFHKALNTT